MSRTACSRRLFDSGGDMTRRQRLMLAVVAGATAALTAQAAIAGPPDAGACLSGAVGVAFGMEQRCRTRLMDGQQPGDIAPDASYCAQQGAEAGFLAYQVCMQKIEWPPVA